MQDAVNNICQEIGAFMQAIYGVGAFMQAIYGVGGIGLLAGVLLTLWLTATLVICIWVGILWSSESGYRAFLATKRIISGIGRTQR
ncbi:MAG: hypothetical protein JRI72_17790 [Deltaproteobacteria bacterium]|nr:hypothetical protein [Deltaproteobacteria bacterium]